MNAIIKMIRGLMGVIVPSAGVLVLGWLMRWAVIGILSVPTWASVIFLVLGCKWFYLLVDLFGGFVNSISMYFLSKNWKIWLLLSAIVMTIMIVNNCILFWKVDAPYGWWEILASGATMFLYIIRSGHCVITLFRIPQFDREDAEEELKQQQSRKSYEELSFIERMQIKKEIERRNANERR